jgi:hypothetical protein
MTIMRTLLAGVLVLGIGWAGSARANDILNGGFESGDFTDWVVSACCTFVEASGGGGYVAEEGNYYAAFGNAIGLGSVSQTFTDTAGSTLDISYFLASNGTTPNEFKTDFDGHTLFDQVDIPTQPYTEYTFQVAATGSDTLTFYGQDTPNWLALDAVSVDERAIPEPASAATLCGGLLGMGLMRRRRRG